MTDTITDIANEPYLLKQAMNTTRGALILTDYHQPDNPIVYANPAFLQLTGYTIKEILGHNCRFLQGKDTNRETVNELRQAVEKGLEVRVTLLNYRKDGSPFWNDLLLSPMRDGEGNITHFIGMQLDISERIEYQRQLEESEKQLRQSNQELEQFTYAASHDLQEPLRMVQSFMQLLQKRYDNKLDEDGQTFIGYAVDGAARMQTLVQDLLLLSRVRTHARPNQSVDLVSSIKTSLQNLRVSVEETKAAIDYPSHAPKVYADDTQIVQLFQNLISNALKYRRPKVRPKITITAKQEATHCHVTIKDNGIGIEQQYLERIFSVFQRLHTREEYPGTGVGLAICQKIVQRLGGRIWVESKIRQGSVFHFTLPLHRRSTDG